MSMRPRARPLLFYVVCLAVALTLPPLLLFGVITSKWVAAEQARLQSTTQETAEDALAQVDQYLSGKVAMLQALATSPAIDAGDFQGLDRQARELLDLQGTNIVMRDLTGQQIVNTRLPWGSALPKVPNYDTDRHVAASKRPYISDIYPGVVANGPLIRVIVPVIRRGEVVFTLTSSIAPKTLSRMLSDAGIVAPHFGSIADRNGRILARAVHDEALVGQPLPGFQQSVGPKGSYEGLNPLGVRVFGIYARSPLSGWMITVGIDKALLDAPLYRSLWWVGSLAVLLAVLAFGISFLTVRRVLLSQHQLTSAADALGNGETVAAPLTPVQEANVIGEALASASSRLGHQAAALTRINRELEQRVAERTGELSAQATLLSATLDNMAQGLMMIDAKGRVPICNQRAMEFLDLPPDLMKSRPTFAEVLRYQLDRGEFVLSNEDFRRWVESAGLEKVEHSYERERPNGLVLEIRTLPLEGGGAVRTYTDVTSRRHSERLAHHMARHDPLTGLPNRTLFRERLAEALTGADGTERRRFAVLCLDLDRFKAVNDRLGHPVGDGLLKVVADRVQAIVGSADTVARLGGDEFAIISADADQPDGARRMAVELIEALGLPVQVDTYTVEVGASVGVAISPDDGVDPDQLFKNADRALYRAKHEGRNTFRFFEAAMDTAARRRQSLEADLRQALSRGEFQLHYQPVVTAETGRISGFEALLRWRHPTEGMISPAEFIPIAEDLRLIVPIGDWVLREACHEAMSWPADTTVAVNVSAVQFQSGGLTQSVLSALSTSRLPARRLEIEITETVLLEETESVSHTLDVLRGLGVRVALDDFGTGYSSLSYLHKFPLDRIKMDRSFMQSIGDETTAAIVRTIIGLGERLQTSITAEGVETQEQFDFVRREGCTEIQGYLFSPPVPAADARRMVRVSATEAA